MMKKVAHLPPAAPVTRYTLPSESSTITGVILDSGRFPGLMKFDGLGSNPNALVELGTEKSFLKEMSLASQKIILMAHTFRYS